MDNVNNLNGVPNFGHGEEISKADNIIEDEKENANEGEKDVEGNGDEAEEVNDF